jgi:hypothetical protein
VGDITLDLETLEESSEVTLPWWAILLLLAGIVAACGMFCFLSCCLGTRKGARQLLAGTPVLDPDPADNSL